MSNSIKKRLHETAGPIENAIHYGAADAAPVRPSSFRISRNSNTPFFPAIQRAASSAPRANPSRLRAVWRSVMVSAGESKPISCVPVCPPARLELSVSEPVNPARADLFGELLQRAGGRIFLGGMVNFPAPGFVFGMLREKRRGARDGFDEQIHADGKIRSVHQRRARGSHCVAHFRQMAVPPGGAANGVHAAARPGGEDFRARRREP